MSTVNACCAVPTACQALNTTRPKKARRTIDGPRRTSLCSWACAHTLAVARPLPVHWLCPLTTPATTPAKVHAGLNRDWTFSKRRHARLTPRVHPQLFFSHSCPSTTTEKARQTALSPKLSLSETTVPLDRPPSTHGAAPDLPVGPYWSLPSTKSPARTSWIPIARPRNLDAAARWPVVARISPLPRRNKLDKTPRHPSRLSGFEKTNDLQK